MLVDSFVIGRTSFQQFWILPEHRTYFLHYMQGSNAVRDKMSNGNNDTKCFDDSGPGRGNFRSRNSAFAILLVITLCFNFIVAQEDQCSSGQCVEEDDGREDDGLKTLLSKLHKNDFYIDGSWTPSLSTEKIDVIDPSTSKPITQVSIGNYEDTDKAVRAASKAFTSWSRSTPAFRRKYVERILELYHERSDEMGLLISREMGAPIDMARSAQAGSGSYHMGEFLEVFDDFKFLRTLPNIHAEDESEIGTTIIMDPIGVVAAITPWNWPMNQIVLKVIPALLVGCTVVLKPSELSPLSALMFAEIANESGVPPGVFNLINGEGPTVGQQLSSHPMVDMVSFTGSTRAAALISKAAADTFKKVTMELGGKGANIIFDDLGDWTDDILRGGTDVFHNSGQSCNAATRMLVQRSIYQKAVDIAKQVAEDTVVDSAHLEGHEHIGPVVSAMHWENVQRYIQSGIDEGALLVAGGIGKPSNVAASQGYYVKPTVFANCTRDMKIFREEIFGPVLCITPFETEEEAIDLANDTPYGLTNYVYSRSGPRRRRLAHALRSGMVEMNDAEGDTGSPFGGSRASGVGREGGIYGLEEFCEVKAVTGYYD